MGIIGLLQAWAMTRETCLHLFCYKIQLKKCYSFCLEGKAAMTFPEISGTMNKTKWMLKSFFGVL